MFFFFVFALVYLQNYELCVDASLEMPKIYKTLRVSKIFGCLLWLVRANMNIIQKI